MSHCEKVTNKDKKSKRSFAPTDTNKDYIESHRIQSVWVLKLSYRLNIVQRSYIAIRNLTYYVVTSIIPSYLQKAFRYFYTAYFSSV